MLAYAIWLWTTIFLIRLLLDNQTKVWLLLFSQKQIHTVTNYDRCCTVNIVPAKKPNKEGLLCYTIQRFVLSSVYIYSLKKLQCMVQAQKIVVPTQWCILLNINLGVPIDHKWNRINTSKEYKLKRPLFTCIM